MTNTRPSIVVRDDFEEANGYAALMVGFKHNMRARGLADGTVSLRMRHVETLHARFPDLLAVTTDDMELILSRRRHTHSAEYRKSMRASWMGFYKWLAKSGQVEEDPALNLSPVRLPRSVARIADDDKVIRALEGASTRDTAMILLGRFAALRLSEIAGLHMSDREGDVLRIKGKGDHVRMVPVNAELLEVLLRLERIESRGYYFQGHDGRPMHAQSVNKIITRATGCNPHSLRHAAATAAYEATHDLRAVQELLGHTNLATTERYIHVRADQVRAAADATSFRKGS